MNFNTFKYIVFVLLAFGIGCQRERDTQIVGDNRILSMLRSDKVNTLNEKSIDNILEKEDLKVYVRLWFSSPLWNGSKWELYTTELYRNKGIFHKKTLCCGNEILPFNSRIMQEKSEEVDPQDFYKLVNIASNLKWESIQLWHKENSFDQPTYVTEVMFRTDTSIKYTVVMGKDTCISSIYNWIGKISGDDLN